MVELNQLNNFLVENKHRNIILFFTADYCTPCYPLKTEFLKLQKFLVLEYITIYNLFLNTLELIKALL